MTQKEINKYFDCPIGQQCNSLYSTPDDRVFIRYGEAEAHCAEVCAVEPIYGETVLEWFPE